MGRGGESRFKGGQAGRGPKQGGAPGWAGPQKGVATDRALGCSCVLSLALTSQDRCSKSAQQNPQEKCQVEAWVKKPTEISDTRHPSEIP